MNTKEEIDKRILACREIIKKPKSPFEKEKAINNLSILIGLRKYL